jgi:hypothetical protein
VIAERKKRKEQTRLRKQQKEQALSSPEHLTNVEKLNNTELSITDMKKAKIAAVVARAKAKKINVAKESANEVENKEQQ